MPRPVVDAELEIYKPGNTSTTPDTTVPGPDIETVELTTRLQDLIDRARITLQNQGGAYTDAITSGDRLRFLTRLDGEASLSHRWTGLARTPHRTETGPATQQLELEADDFVFGVLDSRIVVNSFEERAISGASDAILETILANEAPEIDRSQIQSVGVSTSVTWNGVSLLEAVRELAKRGDAVAANDDTSLVWTRLTDVATAFVLQARDRGLASVNEDDDELANAVRVEGGVGTNVDDSQTTQDSYTTVSSSNRLTHQLSTRKSEVARLELWTRPTGSGDNVVVRLQKDDGGAPVAVSDRESDVARKTLASDFLANDDYTTFLIPSHTLPEPGPWLIIESDGSTGQDIGIDSASGAPTYRAYYPYPLASVVEAQASIDRYRRREPAPIRDETLETRQRTNERARAELRHRREPHAQIEFPAESNRAHNLAPGDVIRVDEPELGLAADCIVTERQDTYDGAQNRLSSAVTAQDIDTI